MADPMLDRIIETQLELATRYLGERIKAQNILNQHGANFAYLDGQYRGRLLKLPQEVLDNVTPFPQRTTVVVNQEPPAESQTENIDKAMSKLEELKQSLQPAKPGVGSLAARIAPWILAAGLGGWGLYEYAKPSPEQDAPAPALIDPRNHGVGFTVE